MLSHDSISLQDHATVTMLLDFAGINVSISFINLGLSSFFVCFLLKFQAKYFHQEMNFIIFQSTTDVTTSIVFNHRPHYSAAFVATI